MPHFRAAWLLPISQPPIRDGWLRTDGGRIAAFGHSRPGDFTASDEIDLGAVAILPGLVNAHTHLELSWMRGRIPESLQFPDWIRAVLELRRHAGCEGEILEAIDAAIREARRFGTALVGDVSNTLSTIRALGEQGMPAVLFYELLGFRSQDARRLFDLALSEVQKVPTTPDIRISLAPHAPYSVSPALFHLIRAELRANPLSRSSLHLGESQAENEFLRNGTGSCRAVLEELGKWDPLWMPPQCSPIDYADQLGFLNEQVLIVHGVQFGLAELQKVLASRATIVTCPRGNIRTGAGSPPVDDFFEAGVRVAVGTDSLASVPDLNIFAELAQMRALAPSVPARRLLESATIAGAHALGFDSDFGTIDPGKRDALIAVDLDGEVSNVEEYLVSGVEAGQVRWLTRHDRHVE
jgi:cytosine/adenosine deaminase-related metal-dependent hydrolase